VSGESGECAFEYDGSSSGTDFRGGNPAALSMRATWKVLVRSGDHIAGFRWLRRVSRRRVVRIAKGS